MRRTKEEKKAMAQAIIDRVHVGGEPISKVMLDFTTPRQAKKAWAAVPAEVLKMAGMSKKGQLLAAMGAQITAKMQEDLVRGRLAQNVIAGKDGGSHSAKLLGSDRRVNMFTPDVQAGLIILNAPQSLIDRKDEILNGE